MFFVPIFLLGFPRADLGVAHLNYYVYSTSKDEQVVMIDNDNIVNVCINDLLSRLMILDKKKFSLFFAIVNECCYRYL